MVDSKENFKTNLDWELKGYSNFNILFIFSPTDGLWHTNQQCHLDSAIILWASYQNVQVY